MTQQSANPWGLTPREVETMDNLMRLGGQKESAMAMKIAPQTVNEYVRKIKVKMDLDEAKTVQIVKEWAAWRGEPAAKYRSAGKPPLDVKNPWRLTPAEVDVMDELCRLGQSKAVARRLNISYDGVRTHISRCAYKMRLRCQVLMAIHWDRWRQGEGKGVPA